MPDKLDYKKVDKELYQPKQTPLLINVPTMNFMMVDGQGAPSGDSYQSAVQILYTLSMTIKMSKMSKQQPSGYFDYVIPPLEGLWWSPGGKLDWNSPKSAWLWTSMIRQPEFVTKEVFAWAVDQCKKKKPDKDVAKARLVSFTEGLSVQIMHIGAYDDEQRSLGLMDTFIKENGLINITDDIHKHHEIYLSDPRKTSAERWKTILRLPVRDAQQRQDKVG